MKNWSLLKKLKYWIAGLGFKLFLWGNETTEVQYFTEMQFKEEVKRVSFYYGVHGVIKSKEDPNGRWLISCDPYLKSNMLEKALQQAEPNSSMISNK